MADYFGSLKLCATCAYWIAQRDTDITNSRVINCENEGRCAIPQGTHKHLRRVSYARPCSDYQKWPVLR